MGNVDIEIYISQLVNFFEKNPNDLMELIGDLQKEEFYEKLRERCQKNYDDGDDITLTRQQIIDVIVELKIGDLKSVKEKKEIIINAEKLFEKTTIGYICLN